MGIVYAPVMEGLNTCEGYVRRQHINFGKTHNYCVLAEKRQKH